VAAQALALKRHARGSAFILRTGTGDPGRSAIRREISNLHWQTCVEGTIKSGLKALSMPRSNLSAEERAPARLQFLPPLFRVAGDFAEAVRMIIRREHNANFTIVPNSIFQDKRQRACSDTCYRDRSRFASNLGLCTLFTDYRRRSLVAGPRCQPPERDIRPQCRRRP
jgi:hypothetical protein